MELVHAEVSQYDCIELVYDVPHSKQQTAIRINNCDDISWIEIKNRQPANGYIFVVNFLYLQFFN